MRGRDTDRPRYWILDGEGAPIPFVGSLDAWASWMTENRDRTRVADTRIGRFRVSTVFLGTAAAWPLFETMILGPRVSGVDMKSERSQTRAEALEAHARACALVRSKL